MSEAPTPCHQTVRIARGKHASPADGACVMELASMLAHEPFTDQPRSVCRVIAAFLRAYNDGADDARRQRLYGAAARVVGTRADRDVERARARRCAELTGRLHAEQSPLRRWLRLQASPSVREEGLEAAAVQLARMLLRHRDDHDATRALAIVDELATIGSAPDDVQAFTARSLEAAQDTMAG